MEEVMIMEGLEVSVQIAEVYKRVIYVGRVQGYVLNGRFCDLKKGEIYPILADITKISDKEEGRYVTSLHKLSDNIKVGCYGTLPDSEKCRVRKEV